MTAQPNLSRWGSLGVFLLLVMAIAATGMLFRPGDWYLGLAKPSWTPPGYLFAPVWSALYLMIAVSGWLAWQTCPADQRARLFRWYGLQLLLNALWSWLFFGLHLGGPAVLDILGLWVAIALTIRAFWPASRLAGGLLIPYFLWVSFAAALNVSIWRMNSGNVF